MQVISKIDAQVADLAAGRQTNRQKRVSETITVTVFITRVTSFALFMASNIYSTGITSRSTSITQTVISSTSITSSQTASLQSLSNECGGMRTKIQTAKTALQVSGH